MTVPPASLDPLADGHRPFRVINPAGVGPFVIFCDHASNRVPADLQGLGLEPADLQRHIAWDIGAAEVSEILSRRLDAPAVLCGTSRLVIDCNRYPEDPNAMPAVSDGTPIPGNASLSTAARAERVERFFRPYHEAIDRIFAERLAAGQRPAALSIHSMTPVMKGRERPWQIALSSHADRRLADPMLCVLRAVEGITVGDNQPYDLDPAEDYSTPVHAIERGLLHLQVEFRQDEIDTRHGAARWAQLFADALEQALAMLRGEAEAI